MLDRFLQAWNALPGEQVPAGRALELREFLLERVVKGDKEQRLDYAAQPL